MQIKLFNTFSTSKGLFLHDWPWILPWIKSTSNELDIIIHVIASQLSGHCDVISNRLWRHQQNVKRASETRGNVWRSSKSYDSPHCQSRGQILIPNWKRTRTRVHIVYDSGRMYVPKGMLNYMLHCISIWYIIHHIYILHHMKADKMFWTHLLVITETN